MIEDPIGILKTISCSLIAMSSAAACHKLRHGTNLEFQQERSRANRATTGGCRWSNVLRSHWPIGMNPHLWFCLSGLESGA